MSDRPNSDPPIRAGEIEPDAVADPLTVSNEVLELLKTGVLTLDANGNLKVAVGDGIQVSSGALAAALGNGLNIDANGNVQIPSGAVGSGEASLSTGLGGDGSGNIAAQLGSGVASDANGNIIVASNGVGATELDGTFPDGSIAKADLGFTPGAPTVRDEARTFTESGLTITGAETTVEDGSLRPTSRFIDGFEDGDFTPAASSAYKWTDESGSDGDAGVRSSGAIDGTYSGYAYGAAGGSGWVGRLRLTRTAGETIVPITYSYKVDQKNSSFNDRAGADMRDANGNRLIEVRFDDSDGIQAVGSTTTNLQSWSANTVYRITINPDVANDEATIIIDGTSYGPFAFANSASGWEWVEWYRNSADSASNSYTYVDLVQTGTGSVATSTTTYLEWPYPPDGDVYSWGSAYFTRTLDNEVVDVYIEENQSSGWTEVAGPISRGDSIPADPANNVRYRVSINRNDTTALPTLDSAVREAEL
ncbi:MAG: hypothetical protein ABEH78_07915 [Haloferacaceae archaeon]